MTPAAAARAPGDPRRPFAFLLALYAGIGCTYLGFNRSPVQILLTVGACCLLDVCLARFVRGFRDRSCGTPDPVRFPLSAVITGLSLSLLLNYAHGSLLFLLPVYLAIGSKYVLRSNGRHIFNPSLFGIAVTLLIAGDLITPAPAYQWGGPLAASVFLAMAALCLFVFRIARGPLIGTFLAAYVVQVALRAWVMRWHLPPQTLFLGALTSPSLLLFAFYMLPDPATSPVNRRDQVRTALAIVAVDLALHALQSLYTLYYAAFLVTLFRHAGREIGDIRRKRTAERSGSNAVRASRSETQIASATAPSTASPSHKADRRAQLVVLAGGVLVAATTVGSALPNAVPGTSRDDPGFRFVSVPAGRSGLAVRPGRTLDEVDHRLRHISKWMLSVGDAVAVGDLDNDGLPDLCFTHPLMAPEDRVALYLGRGALRFARIPLPALDPVVRDPARFGLLTGPLFVDYDNDGDQDLFFSTGYGPCRLLLNRLHETGRATFADVTAESGIGGHSVSLAAQFLDVNRDGRLDLFVANAMAPLLPDYPAPTPLNPFALPAPAYPGDRRMFHFMHHSWYDATNGGENVLYLQAGRGRVDRGETGNGNGKRTGHGPGRRTFVRQDARAWNMPETHWSLAAGTGDLNQDGWPDLYVANDFGPDDLYLNRRGRAWARVRGGLPGEIGHDTYKGMNATLADVNGDGRLDVYVSNVHAPLQAEGSLLWTTHPGADPFFPRFRDEASSLGVLNERRFGWGAAAGDLDLDGDLDLVQANGMVDDTLDRVRAHCPSYWYVNEKLMRSGPEVHTYADRWGDLRGRCILGREANRVYLNRGPHARPRFVDAAAAVGWTEQTNSRGIALADLDNDGDLDAVVTHPFASPSLYANAAGPEVRGTEKAGPKWIGFLLEGDGTRVARDAVGARVVLDSGEGGQGQLREVQTANGFAAQGDRRLLFGLGPGPGPLRLTVRWPNGRHQTVTGLRPGVYYRLRPSGAPQCLELKRTDPGRPHERTVTVPEPRRVPGAPWARAQPVVPRGAR